LIDESLRELTACDALAQLSQGRTTALALAEACLAGCERLQALKAFVTLDGERVRAAARAADAARAGGRPGALCGLPVVVKDNIDVAGLPTTAGTPALRGLRPPRTAPVAAALLDAGAVLLGKTGLHELAEGITNNNVAFGAVRNPYAPECIPGGSSGGTAAAIAARLAPAGLGTDTGGSVRIPAALCGIVGLRPSAGRYPQAGIVPISHTRDTAGPMARSVPDVALIDAVITGAAPLTVPASLRGRRLGVPRDPFYLDLDREVEALMAVTLDRLRAAGADLVEFDLPELGRLYRFAGAISYYEQSRDLDAYLRAAGSTLTTREVAAAIASPDVRHSYETDVLGPAAASADDYREAMQVHRPRLQAAYRECFRDRRVEALLLPTTALPARPIGADREVILNGRPVPTFATYLRNTRIMTVAGIPGLSVPAGLTRTGLPAGLELDAPFGSDRELLALGAAVERELGGVAAPGARRG
jgi:mandelamide amidase